MEHSYDQLDTKELLTRTDEGVNGFDTNTHEFGEQKRTKA